MNTSIYTISAKAIGLVARSELAELILLLKIK
jgi:hypothetical protein